MNSILTTLNRNIFTKRELEILTLISDGNSNKQIAHHLSVTEATVKAHRKNILKKAEGKNIVQIITNSIKDGVI